MPLIDHSNIWCHFSLSFFANNVFVAQIGTTVLDAWGQYRMSWENLCCGFAFAHDWLAASCGLYVILSHRIFRQLLFLLGQFLVLSWLVEFLFLCHCSMCFREVLFVHILHGPDGSLVLNMIVRIRLCCLLSNSLVCSWGFSAQIRCCCVWIWFIFLSLSCLLFFGT